MRSNNRPLAAVLLALAAGKLSADPVISVSTVAPVANSSVLLTVLHPAEGAKLPSLTQAFVFGSVTPGSTVTLNGEMVRVHPKGGYLAMVPVKPGDMVVTAEATARTGEMVRLDRRFTVATGFVISPSTPTTLEKGSLLPAEDLLMSPGDAVRVGFQGSPFGLAEFSIDGVAPHIPMAELGGRGLYEGSYVIQPGDHAARSTIHVALKKPRGVLKAKALGHLTIEKAGIPRVGLVTEDTVAARTAPEGGYDLFLYKGMKVRLSGKIGTSWRVRFAASQNGWVKDTAILEMPRGTLASQSLLTTLTVMHQGDSTIIRAPLTEMVPYRVEQMIDPPQLVISLYGTVDKTDLIKYDPSDPLIQQVRWKQAAPDIAQILIQPKFKKWWGFDIRYDGSALIVEVRKPWSVTDIKGMVIAVDPGHGGSDKGAMGPTGLLEKDGNLAIARVLKMELEDAGAKPFLIRDRDMDVPLYERPRIAWRGGARLYVSVHCNASGEAENPIWNNGYSVYWYQPQSQALAEAVHAGYGKHLPMLQDHGLYFADFAVCRMTQMPSVLTEQAFMIVPEQEQMIFDPKFQTRFADAIVNGIKNFVRSP